MARSTTRQVAMDTTIVQLRGTNDDKEHLQYIAKAKGTTVSALIRDLLFEAGYLLP